MSQTYTDEEFEDERRRLNRMSARDRVAFDRQLTPEQRSQLTRDEKTLITDGYIQWDADIQYATSPQGQREIQDRVAAQRARDAEFDEIDTNGDGEISKREQKVWDKAQEAEDNAIEAEERRIAEARDKSYQNTRKNLRNKDLNELERELFELYNGPNGIARLSAIRNQVRFDSDEEELEENIGRADAIAEKIDELGGDSQKIIRAASASPSLSDDNPRFIYSSYDDWMRRTSAERARISAAEEAFDALPNSIQREIYHCKDSFDNLSCIAQATALLVKDELLKRMPENATIEESPDVARWKSQLFDAVRQQKSSQILKTTPREDDKNKEQRALQELRGRGVAASDIDAIKTAAVQMRRDRWTYTTYDAYAQTIESSKRARSEEERMQAALDALPVDEKREIQQTSARCLDAKNIENADCAEAIADAIGIDVPNSRPARAMS